ncbi:Receptor-like protein kinase FERONIA [Bienertia sinuspersici]
MATNTSTKYKWIPSIFHSSGSTPSSISSSLPSDVCRRFSLAQIKAATCDFDKNLIIGKGGFGEVYKGSILDATNGTIPVAIKRLNTSSKQGAREFQTEIETLSRLRHVHLVPLIGFCEDDGEMILVYEYMSRGTLQDHLMYKNSETSDDNNTPLSWKQRLMICVGSARGLHYLHAGARQLIVHRDVKSTNILLDDKWTAKVSDFGLSKAGPILAGTGPAHFSTTIKGSAGYLDPEYYRRHQLTEKSDVYSFGVVLFEVLCARAVVNPNLPKEQANLAMWAQNHFKKGTLHKIVDPNITSQIAPECLRKFGEIAESCVRDRGSERPSMEDVVWGLEFALQLQETAEKNNHLSGGSLEEVFGSTSNSNLIDGNTDNEVFSTDNFSQSSNGDAATRRLMVHSKTTTTDSSDYPIDMKCDSVFSEIIHPTAR